MTLHAQAHVRADVDDSLLEILAKWMYYFDDIITINIIIIVNNNNDNKTTIRHDLSLEMILTRSSAASVVHFVTRTLISFFLSYKKGKITLHCLIVSL